LHILSFLEIYSQDTKNLQEESNLGRHWGYARTHKKSRCIMEYMG